MLKGDFVFVYGTLRKGQRADLTKMGGGVTFISKDVINGLMYHIGTYPGVKTIDTVVTPFNPEKPIIQGEIFRIEHPNIITLMDAYEGYPSLFDRQEILTRSTKKVWVYTYVPPVREEARIRSGDWVRNQVTDINNDRRTA